MSTAYQECPTEEGMYPTEGAARSTSQTGADKATEKAARLAAARARAEAAKASVARRRQSEAEKPPSQNMYSTEDASKETPKDMYHTEDVSAPAPTPGVPAAVDLTEQLARLQKESEALRASEESLQQRLQWYSEVVGLRKELAVVKEDENALRKQLAQMESAAAAHDLEVDKELTMLEDEAQQSSLQHAWFEACQTCNPDEQDGASVDISNLAARLQTAQSKVNGAQERATVLYAQQEEKINEHTDHRERTKASLRESFDEEMSNLKEARARVRQVESEKAYHYKRGTTRRVPDQLVAKDTLKASRERRIDAAEGRSGVEVDRMTAELSELMDECKVLKKQLDDIQTQQNKKREELETTLNETAEEGADVREFREKLEKEKEELTTLKADLQGVLHYVRAKNREEDEF